VNSDPAILALCDELAQRLDGLADEATEKILTGIPAYHAADSQLRSDVRAHVLSHLRATIDSLAAGRDVVREDLLFVRPHAARRARRISVADFVRAFYIGERVLWEAALGLVDDDESRRAALAFASHLPRYFEVATTHAAEVYLEAQEQLAATGERIRRDLLDDLLAGRELEPGPRRDAARSAGLLGGAGCRVISASPCVVPGDDQVLRGGAAALARATGASSPALSVVRHDEIVIVLSVPASPSDGLRSRLATAQQRLSDAGLPLAVGVSTAVGGLSQVPDAYREASAARSARGATPGVVELSAMSAFEYLTLRPDGTASRLITPAVHDFVAQDVQDGGALIATLREYVDADLNARRAAERLHVHVNTAHYRLGKIAERTGCDLRRVTDLIEILIAARLLDAAVPDGT
jgi:PucR C-terminal helix-turn-helix domain/GGDEF-like domain